MAEQGSGAAFHSLEVPGHTVGTKAMLRPPLGVEHQVISPITIELQECLPSSKTVSFVSVLAEAEMSELLMLVLLCDYGAGSIHLS
jgi:hypothetical protein